MPEGSAVHALFPIVGLGASAGGIQAFRKFFAHVAPDSGMAYVAILHLSPEHESHLAEVLQSASPIPVTAVVARERVRPDRVYVISPRHSLSMVDGDLVPSEIASVEQRRAPVDIFFRTLAESHGPQALCVVLSGTGADGSMGLKRVKEAGGACLVQQPGQAEHPDMPQSALATELADAVLPVEDMPGWIATYWQLRRTVRLADRAAVDEQALNDILTGLQARTGHDFSSYKRATILRRLERRLGVRQQPDLASYAALLREHPHEAQALLKDLLISVTSFFRDREAFETLEHTVIPRLFERREGLVRVWVPACATGEEAYSIAMLLSEHAARVPGSSVQVFATDIDERAIAAARGGLYTTNDAADVPPERLKRFFASQAGGYRVRKQLREIVFFALHNLLEDPPFSHLDLVCCRNLLIYLNRAGQRRVLDTLHFALDRGGYLFVGTSEAVGTDAGRFVLVDKDAHVYQRRGAAPDPAAILPATPGGMAPRPPMPPAVPRQTVRPIPFELHRRLLEQYAPPSVIVDAGHDVVHLSERAGRYLQFAGGEPTVNLLKSVRPELRLDLRTALHQAAQNRASVEARGLPMRVDDRDVRVDVLVRPAAGGDDAEHGFFLVLFDEKPAGDGVAEERIEPVSAEPARHLEDELAQVKAHLRTAVDRYETQTEELRASNEELQVLNEELRSSTEELETSREELQSLNEELRTVNQELKIKVEEEIQASADLQNLVNSTDYATVFLDRDARIKLFTPAACEIFSLIPADHGRALADISSRLVDVDLPADVGRVLELNEPLEREVVTGDRRWYLMRATPYLTAKARAEGVVLTFVDLTARKQAAEQLRRSEQRLRRALEVDTVGVLFFTPDGVPTDANDAFVRMSGYAREQLLAAGRDGSPSTPAWPAHGPRERQALDELARLGRARPYEAEYVTPDGRRWWALVAPTRLDPAECAQFVIDISERRMAEDALRQADRRKNEFLATLSHELRNPLAPIATALQIQRVAGGDGPSAERARATIERQVAHMVRLVEDLLEVSRITLGKVVLRRETISLADVLGAALEGTASQLDGGPHAVSLDVPQEPLWVHADSVRLTQVFANLLNNAAKYTPPGGRISMSASREGADALVSVQDEGMGIARTVLPRVFEMFAQGDEPPAGGSMQNGLGIGLALVRTLVEAHGGDVEARSEGPGRGSEFLVRLPLRDPPASARPASHPEGRIGLAGWRVLVVDDNRDAADSFAMLLSIYGAQVSVAYDGEAALRTIEDERPALVFLDLGLPGVDGLEVARRVRARPEAGRPVLVALTGRGHQDDRDASAEAGFDHHMVKPVSSDLLRDLLARLNGPS